MVSQIISGKYPTLEFWKIDIRSLEEMLNSSKELDLSGLDDVIRFISARALSTCLVSDHRTQEPFDVDLKAKKWTERVKRQVHFVANEVKDLAKNHFLHNSSVQYERSRESHPLKNLLEYHIELLRDILSGRTNKKDQEEFQFLMDIFAKFLCKGFEVSSRETQRVANIDKTVESCADWFCDQLDITVKEIIELAKLHLPHNPSKQSQESQQIKSSGTILPASSSVAASQLSSSSKSSPLWESPGPHSFSVPLSQMAANSPSSLFFKARPSSSPQRPSWNSYSIVNNEAIRQRLQEHGLMATIIAWEDNSRFKNSNVGACITDLWLNEIRKNICSRRSTSLAIIRSNNFDDPTIDVAVKDLGNLSEDLNSLSDYGGPETRGPLVMDTEQVIYSKQATLLPPNASEFEIEIRNNHALLLLIYSDAAEKPSIYICREGWWESKTFGISVNGDIHAFKAEHIVDVRRKNNQPLYAPLSQKEEKKRQLAIVQIPIKIVSSLCSSLELSLDVPSFVPPSGDSFGSIFDIDNDDPYRGGGSRRSRPFEPTRGSARGPDSFEPSRDRPSDPLQSSPRKPAFAPAQISLGTKMREAPDYQETVVERISKLPLRITVQYYSYLSDIEEFDGQISGLAQELKLKDASSLVTELTKRPTESSRT